MADDLVYDVLSDARNELRLLHLDNAEPCTGLAMHSIGSWNLDEAPPYAALSYTWGDPNEGGERVLLNGKAKDVTKNCAFALLQLQRQAQSGLSPCKYFWIDAICIDQSNLVERGHQVNIMGRIFMRAERVFISLGKHSAESEILFRLIKSMPTSMGFAATQRFLCEDEVTYHTVLAGCLDLCNREYWNRAWIVQELVVAKDISVCCGSSSSITLQILTFLIDCAFTFKTTSEDFMVNGRKLNSSSMMQTLSFRRTRQRGSSGQEYRPHVPFLEWLLMGRARVAPQPKRHCLDPRDRVFSMLALFTWPEKGRSPVIANYSMTKVDLAIDIINRVPQDLLHEQQRINNVFDLLDLTAEELSVGEGTSKHDEQCRRLLDLAWGALDDAPDLLRLPTLKIVPMNRNAPTTRWCNGHAHIYYGEFKLYMNSLIIEGVTPLQQKIEMEANQDKSSQTNDTTLMPISRVDGRQFGLCSVWRREPEGAYIARDAKRASFRWVDPVPLAFSVQIPCSQFTYLRWLRGHLGDALFWDVIHRLAMVN